jgi:hypothetical protein
VHLAKRGVSMDPVKAIVIAALVLAGVILLNGDWMQPRFRSAIAGGSADGFATWRIDQKTGLIWYDPDRRSVKQSPAVE